MTANTRIERMREALEAALHPIEVEIIDDSHLHAGHAGHYRVRVIAAAFAGRKALERHRLVYAALASMMPAEIHALSIAALAPDELGPAQPG
jgi:BolA family transcriptional regulator, general stress-responsive regulator